MSDVRCRKKIEIQKKLTFWMDGRRNKKTLIYKYLTRIQMATTTTTSSTKKKMASTDSDLLNNKKKQKLAEPIIQLVIEEEEAVAAAAAEEDENNTWSDDDDSLAIDKQLFQKENYEEFKSGQDLNSSRINMDDIENIITPQGQRMLSFNPFNPKNQEIRLEDIQQILTKYGVPAKVHNIELYRRAFIHRSYIKRPAVMYSSKKIRIVDCPPGCLRLRTKSNERMEFLGDAVLELVTKYYLYRRYPKENESFMTEKKIALIKNEAIGKIAMEMGLQRWFVLSKHAEDQHVRTNLKKLGCLFESFVAAIFLDFNKIDVDDREGWFQNVFICGPGFQMAQIFVESIYEKHVNFMDLIRNDDNYKTILQINVQKEFRCTPHYVEIDYNTIRILEGWDSSSSSSPPPTHINGFCMGVFLCLGQEIHEADTSNALSFSRDFGASFEQIHQYLLKLGYVVGVWGGLQPSSTSTSSVATAAATTNLFVYMGYGINHNKQKAEKLACFDVLKKIGF